MKKYINPSKASWAQLCRRPEMQTSHLDQLVRNIFDQVRTSGDEALLKYTQEFDKVALNAIEVSPEKIQQSDRELPEELRKAISLAKENIETFHKAQINEIELIETAPGVQCWQESRPIERVGIYIPGGSAPLFSTVLMLAIPARIAGCKEVILCTPPDKNGQIDPAIRYAAKVADVDQVFGVGGIQAIGAMTFGTGTIPQVDKIFGPGNQYVTAAKQATLKYGRAIDMPAGPSELLVLADRTGDASFIAADLLSQAEHGPDSQVVLVSTSKNLIQEVEDAISKQIADLPRKEIAYEALSNSMAICLDTLEDSVDFVNQYAPEHYIIVVKDEDYCIDKLQHAGSVFLGPYSPESAGDYASGTNHTLPTNGYARTYSGVNLDAFVKKITFQKLNKKGIISIGPAIEVMAEAEGLRAHKNAISIRLKTLKT